MNNRLLGLLGLAAKAGKIQSGQYSCMKALSSNKAKMVLLSSDLTYRTRKTLVDQANFKAVSVYETGLSQEELGRAIGHNSRCALCIMDDNFASLLLTELKN